MEDQIDYVGDGRVTIGSWNTTIDNLLSGTSGIFDKFLRIMSVCTCSSVSEPYLIKTRVTQSNHQDWRECLAHKVLEYCSRGTFDSIPIHELFVLFQLGFPRALDDHLAEKIPREFTPSELFALVNGEKDANYIDAAILIYKMQQRGHNTKSARHMLEGLPSQMEPSN